MKPFLEAFRGPVAQRPPIWLMRQAGRYLPEYREIRASARSFLDFCYTPELAVEATLQPIRRFGFDAAIIFSDILVIPDALGQQVRFVEGEGPRLDACETPEHLSRLSRRIDLAKLQPVYEALRGVRAALPPETALIGFCGAPWTLATYMIAGKGTPDQAPARDFAYRHRAAFGNLIDTLVEACITHLCAQIEAGAEAVQIFDSWAGVLPEGEFRRYCEEPAARIVAGVNARFPAVPVIAFPRAMPGGFSAFSLHTKADAIGLDTSCRLEAARAALDDGIVTQGNLDPLVLVAGGEALDEAVDHILATTRGTRHVFNLGHGILPHTPIAHVERMLKKVRG
ncbi:MAG: uroporphyrinogen decarboxylase [Proteobacteria bacterium]|nr:uroporphyrinogen decarboxylase [Pseudomonadota bacterium]